MARSFEVEAMVRGYHRYKEIWDADIATTRRFVGKYLVVRFSTTKTTKILPLENYPLYGIVEYQHRYYIPHMVSAAPSP